MSFRLAPLVAALLATHALPLHATEAAPADAAAGSAAAASAAETATAESAATEEAALAATRAGTPAAPALPAVVVTATALTAPVTVQTDLKQPRQPLPAHDGADYLKTIPGFSVIRKGGADGDPVFRGMSGSRLTILADGQGILGGCNARMDAPTAYIYPEAYDLLTVIKGPQSVAHGPGTSAGTILFERSHERFVEPGVVLYASAGVASFNRTDAILDARLGNATGYLALNGSDSRSDDYEDGDGKRVHAEYHRYNAGAALGWTPGDDTLVELSATQSDGEAAYADRSMDGTKFRREAASLRVEQKNLSPLFEKVEFSAYTSDVDHVMDDQELRTPGTMGYANLLRDTDGGRLATSLRVAAPTLLTLGADVQENTHAARSAMPGMPYSALKEDAQIQQYGVFAELQQELGQQNTLHAGYRSDRWQATDLRTTITGMAMPPMPPMAMPNPSANETRRDTLESGFVRLEQQYAGAPVLVYAGLGHVERFPDYWELIAKQGVSSLSAFDIRPEQTDQLDVGALYQAKRLQASASLFYGRTADFILIDYTMKMNGAARNVEAWTWGGELSADYALTGTLKLSSALSYVRGRNDTDDTDLPQLPPLEGRLGLAWDNRVWSAGLLGRFVAEQDRFALNEGNIVGRDLGGTPGFAVLSVNGGYRPTKAVLVSVGIDNVFDRRYAEFVSRAGGNGMGGAIPGYVQTTRVNEPGQMAWLKVNWTLE
ncbi:MAG: tonb-dependent copper receptor [Moraxellaceae bacterium]|jgi:iron complex outermembrane receptor protein|nr:tonb-dependent copper receptor [Moraxellaceae bacterium]